jgi:hypothetical protein
MAYTPLTDDEFRQHQIAQIAQQMGTPVPVKAAMGHLRKAPLTPPDVPVLKPQDRAVLGHHKPDPTRKAMVTVVRKAPPPRRDEEGGF